MLQYCTGSKSKHVTTCTISACGYAIMEPDSAKLVSRRSLTDEKVGGPVKNMGGPIKLLYITMFKIGISCKKLIFGPEKHEKFSRCLWNLSNEFVY